MKGTMKMTKWLEIFLWMPLLSFNLCPYSVVSQGHFPRMENVAAFKPVSTTPARSTCGIPGRTSYCRAPSSVANLASCSQAFCVQECPYRSSTAPYAPLLLPAHRGSCVREDLNDTPGAERMEPEAKTEAALTGQSSVVFQTTQGGCLVSPPSQDLAQLGSLTLAVWIKPSIPGEMVLLEKSAAGRLVFVLTVSERAMVLRYGQSSGLGLLSVSFRTEGRLSLHRWSHLVLQVHDRHVSLFLDGLEEDGTPFDTQALTSMLYDVREDSTMWVGLSSNGTNQFIGRMQDFRFYPAALTNREIVELYTGVLPRLHTQPECRCPPSHPRVHPLIERYCIPNAVEDTTNNRVLRLNLNGHPLSYVNDQDMGTSWLSHTMTTQENMEEGLTITVDLANGQFQVFYVILQFEGMLPEWVVIQRRSGEAAEQQNHSDTRGSPWSDWQYMARDCTVFRMQNNGPLPTPNSVNCLQLPGDAPLSGGNITFALLTPEPNPRPGYNDFYNTPELQRMVQATQVRVLLSGQYHSEAAGVNQGHRYYAIKEITISGRCECHGHADQCDTSVTPYQCACLPESHTEGNTCERCVPLYNDKPFRSGGQFQPMGCRPCQCNSHARSCHYDVSADDQPGEHYRGGGGVCDNCMHNTTGKNCELCRSHFFQLEGADPGSVDVCRPCNCNTAGTLNGSMECDQVGGQCRCKAAVTGRQCADCLPGWFDLQGRHPQGCVRCNCSGAGLTRGPHAGRATCDQHTGQCHCKPHVTGISCDRCEFGFWNLSQPDGCVPCDCDPLGSLSPYCEPQGGQCECRPGVGGSRCSSCGGGSYGLGLDGSCTPCNCSAEGTVGGATECDPHTGQCVCKENAQGLRCDSCRRGYHSLDRRNSLGCLPCACDPTGTVPGGVCHAATGQCPCHRGAEGSRCTRCAQNYYYYYYNSSHPEAEGGPRGCVPCTCDPRGTVEGTVCHSTTGQCVCLHTHHRRDCGSCRPGFYLEGGQCVECDCHPTGALRRQCEGHTGWCPCAHPSVGGQRCDQCREMYHGFNPGLGSCQPCTCDPVGSVNRSCHPDTGVCVCKALVTGDQCNLCLPGASHMDPNNHLGCSKAPSQQPPPSGVVLGVSYIRLSWLPPDSPNSHRLNYTLLRDALPVYSLLSQYPYRPVSFEDTGLSPYTSYSYWLLTSSVAGQTESVAVSYQTLAAVPDAQQLQLKLLGSPGHTSASFNWTRPRSHAGPVERFVLSSIESTSGNRTVHHSSLSTEATAGGLKPFTFYTFTLEACSAGGCSSARPLSLRTAPAPPTNQPPPRVNVTGPHTMHLIWEPPTQPNGVITQYEVFLRGPMETQNLSLPANGKRVFISSGWQESDRNNRGTNRKMVQPPESSAIITGLQPFSTYQMRIASVNTAGHATSEWATARTAEGAPEFVSPPQVSAVSSSSLRVSWNATEGHGVVARGTVTEYRVNMVMEQSSSPYAPPVFTQVLHRTNASSETAHVVEGLRPYQVYNFTITLCTSAGCITSLPASGQTRPAAPSGLKPPRLRPINESTVHVEWSPPGQLNGPPPVYQVERTDVSLSDPSEPVTRGTRFPGSSYYRFPSQTLPVNTDYTGIQLSFRSRSPDGLLLCAFSPGGQEEFLALQIQQGRPYFLFDPQDFSVAVSVQDDGSRRYDDGEWHSVTATRHGAVGTIIVDHQYQGRAGGSSLSSIIGENTGLYVGGLPTDFTIIRQHLGDTQLVRKGFSGCLRDIKLKHTASPAGEWRPLDWSTAIEKVAAYESWEGCPVDSEEGAHFLGHGYLELNSDVFSGGKTFDITMEFRTDQLNAILIFTYSNESDDFMLVELESGLLYFILSWGGHVTELSMWVGLSYCDGEWNQFSLTKRGSVISAAVNDWEERLTGAGGEGGLSVDSSLYLGGVPTNLMHPALASNSHRNGLGGCLRRLTVQSDGTQPPVVHTVNLSAASHYSVRVHLDGCSAGDSRFLCRGNDSVLVYSGREMHARDYSLQPFTEYLYRYVAVAAGGWSAGPWQRGRSQGTVPKHILPPSMVQSKNGFSAEVKWAPPTGDVRGLIDRYELRAYQRDHPDAEPVVESIHLKDGNHTGLLSGLIPSTRYIVTVSVCSPSGCTESQRHRHEDQGDDEGESWSFTTPEEAPEAVHPPAGVASPFTLNITWQPPARPNGRITSYHLYHNHRRIYMGNHTHFNITALGVYSTHVLVLSACTSAGCSNSSQVTMVTSQLPPGPLQPPNLTLLDARTILVEWSRPVQVNGVLQSYSVFLSREEAEPQPVYNSTHLHEDHTLHNLVPGTAYAVRVAACTGGGCTLSPASHARTEESTPENVPAPLVTPLSPHAFNVTWTPPDTPNGIITSYGVWLDGELLLNSSSSQSSFVVEGLSPWSLHTLGLQACTVQGCGRGPTVEMRTQETPPVGAVLLDMTNQSSRALRARWTRPARPNGNLSYTLHFQSKDGEGVLSGGSDAGSWLTVSDLRPHTSYTFWVTACNTLGCVESPARNLTTLPAAPDGLSAPRLADSSATSLNVSWSPPAHTNAPGPLLYGLRMKSAPQAQEVSLLENTADVLSYSLGGLSPFTSYYFRLLASHTYGHVSSPWASLRTAQGRPGPVAAPLVVALHSRNVTVSWLPPSQPNGLITNYTIYLYSGSNSNPHPNSTSMPATITSQGLDLNLGPNLAHATPTAGDDQPSPGSSPPNAWSTDAPRPASNTNQGTAEAMTSPGTNGDSNPTNSNTAELAMNQGPTGSTVSVPFDDGVPEMSPIPSDQLLPSALSATVPGNTTSFTFSHLRPYHMYTLQVEACTSAGCSSSDVSPPIHTPPAPPEGVPAPQLYSLTPTSVLLSWGELGRPNGPLEGWLIERRVAGTSQLSTVGQLPASAAPLSYLDFSSALSPWTSYQYRLVAHSQAGRTAGPWANVTTKPSRPAGLSPPRVTVLGPESLQVTWSPPLIANGEIRDYEIRLPHPRVPHHAGNGSQLNVTLTGLVPFTHYNVTVLACSTGAGHVGGCTESLPTPAKTLPTIPQGLAPLSVVAVSESFLAISWQLPSRPNGPNIRYELLRRKTHQPLAVPTATAASPPPPPAEDLHQWFRVYSGTKLFYQDKGLSRFTRYQYQLLIHNDVDYTSGEVVSAVTMAGVPLHPPSLTVLPVNHTAIQVNWTKPSLHDLQGEVDFYFLTVQGANLSETLTFPPGVLSTVMGDLWPSTSYRVSLHVSNGAHNTSETVVRVTTEDGEPEGLSAPEVVTVNSSAVRVLWSPPLRPNGAVTAYHVYLDNHRLGNADSGSGSYLLDGLLPFTIYNIQVEVCTVYACVRSNVTQATTVEDIPAELTAPLIQVLNSRAVRLEWSDPGRPSGIMLGYEILRRALRPCDERSRPENQTEKFSCSYLQCPVPHAVCGASCFQPDKQVCCDGVSYIKRIHHQCCGRWYLFSPNSSHSVCCGDKLLPSLPGHQCCGGYYVAMNTSVHCCPDPSQGRVSVGEGDSCCGGAPFSQQGPQLCCAGALHDAHRAQCCGGHVVDSSLACCGGAERGRTYTHTPGFICCGQEYVNSATSLCCVGHDGHPSMHPAGNSTVTLRCCGSKVIHQEEECCNGIGYDPQRHVCADRPTPGLFIQPQCAQAAVCPVAAASTAYCGACDLDPSLTACTWVLTTHTALNDTHARTGAHTAAATATPSPLAMTARGTETTDGPQRAEEGSGDTPPWAWSSKGLCPSLEEVVYSGDADVYTYTDSGALEPFTTYEYRVRAWNSFGKGSSAAAAVTTSEEKPWGVAPPRWSRLGDDVLQLSWQAPARPNGDITHYIIMRDGQERYRGADVSFADVGGIRPFVEYSYQLSACNRAGCSDSEQVVAVTVQGVPEDVAPPVVTPLTPTSLLVSWPPPKQASGIIQRYLLHQTGVGLLYTYTDRPRNHTVTGLQPFTEYSFELTACTAVGCGTSQTSTGRTLQASPSGVWSRPRHLSAGVSVVELYWSRPLRPNGQLSLYRLLRDGRPVFTGDHSAWNFTDTGLSPNHSYVYELEASTGGGTSMSDRYVVQTPASSPSGIPPPHNVTVAGARSLFVAWSSPASFDSSQVLLYNILFNPGSDVASTRPAGQALHLSVTGLEPFTSYYIRVQACQSAGCGVGQGVFARTLEAPPEALLPPRITAAGAQELVVRWSPPQHPNGLITSYFIHRRPEGTEEELLVFIWSNGPLEFIDASQALQPFSQYQYRVQAHNSKGSAQSQWASALTLEAPPKEMSPPTIVPTGAYSALLKWSEPRQPNGLVSQYRVVYKKHQLDPTLDSSPVTALTVEGTVLEVSVYGLQPYTEYSLRVEAVNSAGSVSSEWVGTRTLQASPAGLTPLQAEHREQGRALLLSWDPPHTPNGVITTYNIYSEGNLEFSGLSRYFLFRRLQPWTVYTLVLEACTARGCVHSPPQQVTTSAAPPTAQPPPRPLSIGPNQVSLTWDPPSEPNGPIKEYALLGRRLGAEARGRSIEEDIINETVLFTEDHPGAASSFSYTVVGLRPWTQYQFSVRSRNNAGHTLSAWVTVTTKQAPPSGLAPPTVTHIEGRPNELLISWAPPLESNGVLLSYRIQRDHVSFSFSFDPAVTSYNDEGLTPFTTYSYAVIACTSEGCVTSPPTDTTTLEAPPATVGPPGVQHITPQSIKASWTVPATLNGRVTEYVLRLNGEGVYRGPDLFSVVSDLQPHTSYRLALLACTSGGCTPSTAVTIVTGEAPPTGLQPPTVKVTGPESVEVSWTPPEQPNGVVTGYELRRDDEVVYVGPETHYHDFTLLPNVGYSYVVVANNSQGAVSSAAAIAKTHPSAPSGVGPPTLQPLGPSQVRVDWSPPARSNGDLVSYTVYQRDPAQLLTNSTTFTPQESAFSVRHAYLLGLAPYHRYEVRVEACTALGCSSSDWSSILTPESPPAGQTAPLLHLQPDPSTGLLNTFLLTWSPPAHPHGIILDYEVYRKLEHTIDVQRGAGTTLVCRNISTTCRDNGLQPYTAYQYQVWAVNSAGHSASPWANGRTGPAPPEGIDLPTFQRIQATWAVVDILPPAQPNGIVSLYRVFSYSQDNNTYILLSEGTSHQQTLHGLSPYTLYWVGVEACTCYQCCSRGPLSQLRTPPAPPAHQPPPRPRSLTSRSVQLEWDGPLAPNGVIESCELHIRPSCPQPPQPVLLPCVEGPIKTCFFGPGRNYNLTGLQPHFSYKLRVACFNNMGSTASNWTAVTTRSEAPQYVSPFSVDSNVTLVWLDWGASFSLNGPLRHYTVTEGRMTIYTGFHSYLHVPRTSQKTLSFQVTCTTHSGSASTPLIRYSPVTGLGPVAPTEGGKQWVGVSAAPVYSELWFILLLSLLGLFLLFLVLGLVLRRALRKSPSSRERPPLVTLQKTRHGGGEAYMRPCPERCSKHRRSSGLLAGRPPQNPYTTFDTVADHVEVSNVTLKSYTVYTEGLTDTKIIGGGSRFSPMSVLRVPSQSDLGHAFSQHSLHRSVSQLMDRKSLMEEGSWDNPLAQDSGLYVEEDEFVDAIKAFSSMRKDHTMFTDTHL